MRKQPKSTGFDCQSQNFTFSVGQTNITNPFGIITDPHFPSFAFVKQKQIYSSYFCDSLLPTTKIYHNISHIIKYTFQLDPKLRINLTFLHLYQVWESTKLPSKLNYTFFPHYLPKIVIQSFSHSDDKQDKIFLTQRLPKFFVFSTYSMIIVKNYPQGGSFLLASLVQEVFDNNNYLDLNSDRWRQNSMAPWIVKGKMDLYLRISFPVLKKHIESYHCLVEKYLQIRITIVQLLLKDCIVFDGPGPLSKMLEPFVQNGRNTTTFKSSQFQIFMVMALSLIHFPDVGDGNIKITSFVQPSNLIKVTSSYNLTLPNKNICVSQSLCILYFEGEETVKLNFSFYDFSVNGSENKDDCSYAGLALYSGVKLPFIFIQNICVQDHMASTFQYCDLVSGSREFKVYHDWAMHLHQYPGIEDSHVVFVESSCVTLVFYAMEAYAQFSVTVALTASNCALVQGPSYHDSYLLSLESRQLTCQVIQFQFSELKTTYQMNYFVYAHQLTVPLEKIEVTAFGVLTGE